MGSKEAEKREQGSQVHLVIAGWTLEEDRHCLVRDAETVKLEPKTTQLLAYMARHASEPLSRETLLTEIWHGVVVGDEALTTSINKIRRAFGDSRGDPTVIETIPKMGYRLIAPVNRTVRDTAGMAQPGHQNASDLQDGGATDGRAHSKPRASNPTRLVVVILLGIAVILGVYLVYQPREGKVVVSVTPGANIPAVAIAPFKVLGDDPEQEYLARGLTADLISQLSSLSGLFVTSASPGMQTDLIDEVRLDKRYEVWGGVRRDGNRLRIQVRLIETANGSRLWIEEYERPFDHLFEIQSEIATQLALALSVKVSENEQIRLAHKFTRSVEAYDLFLRAQSQLIARRKENYDRAAELYLRAVTLDPSFARAYAGLALVHAGNFRNQWAKDREGSLVKALEFAHTALEIDPTSPQAEWALGYVKTQQRRHKEALVHLEQALKLEPGFSDALALKGGIMTYMGKPEATVPLLREAIRRNPAAGYLYFMTLGRAYFFLDDQVQAIINLREAANRNPASLEVHVILAAALGRQGDYDEAEWEAAEVQAIRPGFSVRPWLETHPLVDQGQIEKLSDELRKLGL